MSRARVWADSQPEPHERAPFSDLSAAGRPGEAFQSSDPSRHVGSQNQVLGSVLGLNERSCREIVALEKRVKVIPT